MAEDFWGNPAPQSGTQGGQPPQQFGGFDNQPPQQFGNQAPQQFGNQPSQQFGNQPAHRSEQATPDAPKGKKGIFLGALAAILVILILIVGVVAFKKVLSDRNNPNDIRPVETTSQETSEPSKDNSLETEKDSEKGSDEGVSKDSKTSDTKSNDGETKSPTKVEYTDPFENEVQAPPVDKVDEVTGGVLDKKVFQANSQFIYRITLQLPGEGDLPHAEFYATRTAFDTLKVGDIVKVKLSKDAQGNITLMSVTKM